MNPPPLTIYSAAQIREMDRAAAAALGVASYELMRRAGASAFALLCELWPKARRIVVVCGPGANGGDGYVLARCAREAQLDVRALTVLDPAQLQGDARNALEDYIGAGGVIGAWDDAAFHAADVIVDALFGIGLSRPIEGRAAECVRAMNAASAPTFALDIPSGLHADTGRSLGEAVDADATLTFIGLKLGFYVGVGQDHTGRVYFDALGAPPEVLNESAPAARLIDPSVRRQALPPRRRTAHKGDNGHVLVIGGGRGMAGAARMCGEAALRVGAGLVTVATRPESLAAIVGARPELMCRAIEDRAELDALISRADVLALGPGLGQDEWSQMMFEAAIASDRRIIIDADGLNLLARKPRGSANWALTPHPGEAARLLGCRTSEVQDDRIAAVHQLSARYQGPVVLKGAGSIVMSKGSPPAICERGNPGMATPGMGDVLTGVIAGIAAQGAPLSLAAEAGVLVHAMAGDLAANRGERGLTATDLFEHLPGCVNPT